MADSPEITATDLGLGEETIETEIPQEAQESVQETEAQQVSQESVQQLDTPESRPMPQSWKKEYGEYWESLDPKVQEIFETREKQMLDGLEQYKEHSGFGQQMREAFNPYQQYMEQQGVDPVKAVQYLLNAHYRMNTASPEEKRQIFNQLAQQYQLNPEQDQNLDPAVKALKDQVTGLQQTLTQQTQLQQSAARENAVKQVEEFAADKPYFDEVADDIVAFINAGRSLEDAYEQAVWANPATRAKEMARVQTESEQALKEKAKAEAEAAKKSTATNVRGRDTTRTPTEPTGTMEDTMRETLKDIRGRVH